MLCLISRRREVSRHGNCIRATQPRKPALRPGPKTWPNCSVDLGNIPAFRVRLQPPTGTATEKDLVRYNESKLKTAICELVEGTLVEKAMGWTSPRSPF